MKQGLPANRSWALVTIAAALLSGSVRAEPWVVGAGERVGSRSGTGIEIGARGGYAAGVVPEFRSAERDRTALGVDAQAWLAGRVRLTIDWEWLWTHGPATEASGPGDIHLGTAVRALTIHEVALGVGWEAKLPDAANEAELGTDETDITFGAWSVWGHGPWSLGGAVGLGIYGNPLRFANQDDVPLLRLDAAFCPGPWRARVFSSVDVATARNPARAEVGGAFRLGADWFAEVEAAAGLTPAAPDARVTLRLGRRFSLPRPPSGE